MYTQNPLEMLRKFANQYNEGSGTRAILEACINSIEIQYIKRDKIDRCRDCKYFKENDESHQGGS